MFITSGFAHKNKSSEKRKKSDAEVENESHKTEKQQKIKDESHEVFKKMNDHPVHLKKREKFRSNNIIKMKMELACDLMKRPGY